MKQALVLIIGSKKSIYIFHCGFVWFLVATIDQHYLSAFVECILSLTMTAFEILNLLIMVAYIIRDVGVGWDWHN